MVDYIPVGDGSPNRGLMIVLAYLWPLALVPLLVCPLAPPLVPPLAPTCGVLSEMTKAPGSGALQAAATRPHPSAAIRTFQSE